MRTQERRIWRYAAIIGFVSLLPTSMAAGQANGTDEGVPALKITAPSGRSSIMVGSVHVGVAGLRQPAARIFDGVKLYVVEQVPGENSATPWQEIEELTKKKVSTGHWTRAAWSRWLTDDIVAKLRERVRCSSGTTLTTEQVDNVVGLALAMKRPLWAEYYAIRRCEANRKPSRDQVLKKYADARGIRSAGLELDSEVQPRRLNVPDHIYINTIRIAVTERQAEALQTTAAALNRGDYDAILLALNGLAANEADAQLYQRLMLDDRNEAWIPKLIPYLNEGNALINVGAAHLPGQKGLINLLRTAGFRVEPVMLPASQDN